MTLSRAKLLAAVTHLLAPLERGENLRETLEPVLAIISQASGCESVGIRWRGEEDYPYLVTRGFDTDFVIRESLLCERDSAGLPIELPDGTPLLACMCGAVIQGRTDPALPYFTEWGSFWTNGTTELLRRAPPSSQGIGTRNYCNEVGYESVALVPLRDEPETHGLLQLNSRRPDRFTERRIRTYEKLAGTMTSAMRSYRTGH